MKTNLQEFIRVKFEEIEMCKQRIEQDYEIISGALDALQELKNGKTPLELLKEWR